MPRHCLLIVLLCVGVLTGCATATDRRLANPTWCEGLQTIIAATPADGRRSLLVYWPEPAANEADIAQISFYAAMQADPMDAAAEDFYSAYGRATHYYPLSDLGRRLQRCMGEASGFRRSRSPELYVSKRREVQIRVSQAACGDTAARQPCIAIAIRPRETPSALR